MQSAHERGVEVILAILLSLLWLRVYRFYLLCVMDLWRFYVMGDKNVLILCLLFYHSTLSARFNLIAKFSIVN